MSLSGALQLPGVAARLGPPMVGSRWGNLVEWVQVCCVVGGWGWGGRWQSGLDFVAAGNGAEQEPRGRCMLTWHMQGPAQAVSETA